MPQPHPLAPGTCVSEWEHPGLCWWEGPQDQDQVGPGTSQHLGDPSLPAFLFGEISFPELCLT